MIVKALSQHLSIEERMHKVHKRMHLESISGISAANKEEFLAFCRAQEGSGSVANAQDRYIVEAFDSNAINWRNFDDWNNSPGFSLDRRKVKVN